MKKLILFVILMLVIAATYVVGFNSGLKAKSASSSISSNKEIELNADVLWYDVQLWRKSEHLPEYIKDDKLCKIAIDRADDPQLDNHAGFYKKYSDYPYVLQENVNKGYSSEAESLSGWLGSKPHHDTLLKPYKYSCVATYKDVAVQIFSNL